VIEEILPAAAVAVEAFDDKAPVELFPEEEAAIGRAVPKRRREFATARDCAHRALQRLGLPPGPVPVGEERGEPVWPAGVVGSITHCRGYRCCAVARAAELASIGVDAEPHEPLPDGLIGDLANAEERAMLHELAAATPAIHWDRLLFSAKESVYKAWYPLTRRWLGFEDALLTIDPAQRRFEAKLLVPGPTLAGGELRGFAGRWLARDGLLVATIAVSRSGES
jgi:4'-phosphopantetheinyl transferase EntD